MKKKRIALVMYSLNIGGAEKVLADLSIEYAKTYEVTLVLFDTSLMYYPYAGKVIDINSPASQSKFKKAAHLFYRAWRLRQIFRENQFDHIISFMENANLPAIMANGNVVAANHCNPNMLGKWEWWFMRWLYPRAKKIVAVSKAGAEIFRQRIGLTNVTYIHNPISLKRIAEQSQQAAEVELPDKFIVAVGRLSPEKNFKSLISAFAKSGLPEKGYELIILGEGAERQALTVQIKTEGLIGRVSLPGFTANPYVYLTKAKCLVLSSLNEGFPVILAEALACGCPVIATRCETGPDEIIDHEKNGLLVPVDDTPALTQALDRLISDTGLYQAIKSNAKDSVKHLDISEVAQRWLEL